MKNMEKLRDLVCMTLDEYADKSNMSMADLEAVYKMVDIIKDIGQIGNAQGAGTAGKDVDHA